MEQLKQILQLKNDGIAIREIARRTGLSRNSVKKYLSLLKADSDSSEALSNKALAAKAYSTDVVEHNVERLHELLKHFKDGHTELKKTGVTRQLLWQEYLQLHPDGYVYSHYCYHLNQYLKNKNVALPLLVLQI